MEERKDALGMLDLITAPGFCVSDNQIIKVNTAAAALFFAEGMDVLQLLSSGAEEYRDFTDGCLCLSVQKDGISWNAAVTRQQDIDVFILEQDVSCPELQALALAARELRSPLNSAMLMANKLLDQQDPDVLDSVSRLNRGLYQLLRIVGNMSDAGYTPTHPHQTLHDISRVMDEIFQKVQLLTAASGLTLTYAGLPEAIYSLCDPDQLERAVMNILSNAIKFTPKGGTVDAAFTRSNHMLRLSIRDNGSGIAENRMRSIFCRYLRQSALEDNRYGIGLGMVLIRSTALQHGGTVLVDSPEGGGTRVTLTLKIRQDEPRFSTRIVRPVAGGYDSGLIEFSEVLPADMYNGKK